MCSDTDPSHRHGVTERWGRGKRERGRERVERGGGGERERGRERVERGVGEEWERRGREREGDGRMGE